jgi:hypothetical protein
MLARIFLNFALFACLPFVLVADLQRGAGFEILWECMFKNSHMKTLA